VDFLKRGQDVWNKIEDFPKPVIAAVNGHALGGGCELALACHFRIVKKGAKIGLTETNLGIMPGYGGTLRLPRYIGRAKALEYMVLGKQMTSDEAFALGVANRLSEEGQTLDDAILFAGELVKRPPIAVKALLKIFSMSPSVSPEQHLKAERERTRETLRNQGHGRGHDRVRAEKGTSLQGTVSPGKRPPGRPFFIKSR
jgi:enoyl-CoA hydratase/carnithine racemase